MRGGGAAADVGGDGAGEDDRRRFLVGFPATNSGSGFGSFDEKEEPLSETGSADADAVLRGGMESARHLLLPLVLILRPFLFSQRMRIGF